MFSELFILILHICLHPLCYIAPLPNGPDFACSLLQRPNCFRKQDECCHEKLQLKSFYVQYIYFFLLTEEQLIIGNLFSVTLDCETIKSWSKQNCVPNKCCITFCELMFAREYRQIWLLKQRAEFGNSPNCSVLQKIISDLLLK